MLSPRPTLYNHVVELSLVKPRPFGAWSCCEAHHNRGENRREKTISREP